MTSAAASRYARALADVVLENRSTLKPEDAVAQVRAIEQTLAESTVLAAALETPAIQTSRKRAAMGKLMDELQTSRVIRNFVFVIIDHKRTMLLPQIREAFETAMDEHLGYVRADVTSAAPLEPQQSKQLEAELAKLGGKKVRIRYAVDDALLGGVVARIGSTVYDGSIRGQLQQMRREWIERSTDY